VPVVSVRATGLSLSLLLAAWFSARPPGLSRPHRGRYWRGATCFRYNRANHQPRRCVV